MFEFGYVVDRMPRRIITRSSSLLLLLLSVVVWMGQAGLSAAFVQTSQTPGSKEFYSSHGRIVAGGKSAMLEPPCSFSYGNNVNRRQSTELYSFMGSDGGLLGIGTPELFTIILIGYFVLGPSDLYKLVKEIGKFIQNFQTFASEATATLENNMESQLQLEEIRKAQKELNDAFSFRRSINVEADSDPFEVNVQSPRGQDDIPVPTSNELEYDLSTTATTGAAVAPKKKKMRRVKRKKKTADTEVGDELPKGIADAAAASPQLANDIPAELDIDEEVLMAENRAMEAILNGGKDGYNEGQNESSQLASQIRDERMERLQNAQSQEPMSNDADSSIEQSRFQQQLSGNWNDQIVANSDKLEPLAEVMNLLAVLEEEKNAADKRLQEEFKAREANEEKFYLEKRKLLEEAAAEIQASAYAGNLQGSSSVVSESGNK